MNCFSQLENGIFATEKDIQELKNKDSAHILVYSDSHGKAPVVRDIFEKFGQICDAAIFAGDGIFDLLALMEKANSYDEISEWLPPVICIVRGNNDSGSYETSFCRAVHVPKKVLLEVGAKRILVTHGHEERVQYSTELLESTANLMDANAVVYGHSHIPVENNHVIYSMNPGSCSYPRSLSKPGCAVLEISGKNIFSIFYKIDFSIFGLKDFVPYFPDRMY